MEIEEQNVILAQHPTFETERLLLRKLRLDDAEAMFSWASDPEVAAYVSWTAHKNMTETRQMITRLMSAPLSKWGLVDKSSSRLIGTIDFRITGKGLAEFGWALSREYWGRGLMPEAAATLVKFCFEELGLEVLCAIHNFKNPKSGRVMEKIGMRRLGQLYSSFDKFDKPVLDVYWALTKEEYDNAKN